MDRPRRSYRTPASAVTATSLLVLVAMGSLAAAVPGPAGLETRTLVEGKAVRAVAEAAFAVARDLMGGERPAPALPAAVALEPLVAAPPLTIVRPVPSASPVGPPLDERLLDLPPPVARS